MPRGPRRRSSSAVDAILDGESVDFLAKDRMQYAMMVVDHIERLLPLARLRDLGRRFRRRSRRRTDCTPTHSIGRDAFRSRGPVGTNRHGYCPDVPGAFSFSSSVYRTAREVRFFGSRRPGQRESRSSAPPLQAEGAALRTVLGAAQASLLREAERPEEEEARSGDPTRAQTPAPQSPLASQAGPSKQQAHATAPAR